MKEFEVERRCGGLLGELTEGTVNSVHRSTRVHPQNGDFEGTIAGTVPIDVRDCSVDSVGSVCN